jgi:hypothetical protein
MHKISSIGGHCQGMVVDSRFFQTSEGFGVQEPVTHQFRGDFVTAQFSLKANALGQPPDRGMVEQESLGGALDQVDEIVKSTDVGQFVGK